MTSCLMKNLDVIQCQKRWGGGREREGWAAHSSQVLTQVCNNTNLKHKKFHLVKICSEKSMRDEKIMIRHADCRCYIMYCISEQVL